MKSNIDGVLLVWVCFFKQLWVSGSGLCIKKKNISKIQKPKTEVIQSPGRQSCNNESN